MIKKLFLCTSFLVYAFTFFGQCDQAVIDTYVNDCASSLKAFEYSDAYKLLRNQFTYGGEKIEYKKTFYKGTTYAITLKDASVGNNKLVAEIFDDRHHLVASTHIKHNSKFYSKIYFPCKATGVYYIRYSFNDHKPSCGASVLGFSTDFMKKRKADKK